ncbi:MAG: hypothetical protein EXQ84_05165 [Rhodospirillaceae bacterium]|nr:hypothetical protein [Rhodospirillaceae bacterium]
MSAPLKTFLDRLTDLTTIRKDLGKMLKGKAIALLTSGTDDALPEGFEVPFRSMGAYFGMNYLGRLT